MKARGGTVQGDMETHSRARLAIFKYRIYLYRVNAI